jgi:hypothetical protein
MTEEKVVWDIPRYHDCAKCSRDGLLAVHTKEGVTVYVPKFESASLTLSPRWFQLVGTNDLSKEPQPAISAIPATGIECASWLRNSTVSPLDDRINDPNKVCVTQIDWSPPGVGNGRPSLLGVQFSNGIAAVFDFGTNDVHKLELLGCGRQSVALYGLNVAWDVSASLKMESSAKSDAVTRVRSIIAIRWLPHLIQSSSGYIYLLFAIATDDGIISMWKVSELPTTNRSNERSAQSLSGALLLSHKIIEDEGISTVSITSLAISPCAKSDFNASCFTVLVGTAKGYIHYVSVNLEAVSSTAARSYRHFQHPVETMNIFEVETGKNLLVTKSNMKLVVAELGDGGAAKEGPFHQINNEDVHSNLISSVMCVMNADTVKQAGCSTSLWSSHVGAYFPASSYHDALLSTFISASLDGTIRVWSATRPRSTSSSSSTSLPSERAQRTSNIIPDDESMVLLDVPFVSVVSGYNGSILGLAADPLGLTICRVKAIGPNESGSREVQMNVRLRRPHCDLTHHINPCISPSWVIDASNSKALLSTIIHHGGFVSSIDHSNMLSNENEIGPRSFAGVPHLWLMSVRDVLESMPMERAGVSAEEVGNDGDDSGDEEKTGGGGSVKAPARNMTTPGDEKGGFSLIYRRVDDIRHKILERVIADSVRTIVESCASLASEELSKLATESDYFTVTPPVTPSGSADGSFTGRSELFRIPTGMFCVVLDINLKLLTRNDDTIVSSSAPQCRANFCCHSLTHRCCMSWADGTDMASSTRNSLGSQMLKYQRNNTESMHNGF